MILSDCAGGPSAAGAARTRRAEVKTLAAPNLDDAAYGKLETLGKERGFNMIRASLRDHLAGIDLAFTTAEAAIAETATCVLESMNEDLRLATMIAEVHVVALKKSRIVPGAYDAEGYLQKLMESGPMYTAFISGPSRTADIERVLTLGVHGPLNCTSLCWRVGNAERQKHAGVSQGN